ncbi:hypothetical protein JCM1841_003581 [Sporobolomyces salmonicolor]
MAPDRTPASANKSATKGEAKTRSRQGCLTCRSRHKKCDETRLPEHNGHCKRCFSGSWECKWPVPPGERPLKSFVKGVKGARGGAQSSAGGSEAGDGEIMDGQEGMAGPEGEAAEMQADQAPIAVFTPTHVFESGVPSSFAGGHPVPSPQAAQPFTGFPLPLRSTSASMSFSPPPRSQPLPYQPQPHQQPPAPSVDLTDPLASLPIPQTHLNGAVIFPGEDLSEFFANLDAELGYWDTLGLGLGQAGNNSAREALSTSMPTPVIPSPVPSQPRLDSLQRPSLNISPFAPAPAAPLPSTSTATSSVTSFAPTPSTTIPSPAQLTSQPVSTPLPDPEEPPAVDPIYNDFNEGFFRSLPKPVRDIVVKRIYNITNSTELGRNASMAMVMLYRLRMQQSSCSTASSDGADEQPVDPQALAEAQARLLAQSDHYFQRALEHLQTPIPFEAKIIACLDMQFYQFDQWGAAAANAILLLGEYFITEALGSQPALDVSTIRDSANVILATFAYTDCIRCICIPRRRTIFAFSHLPGEPSPSSPSLLSSANPPNSHSIETHLGLPVGLLLCIAAIANLSAEMEALPDEVVRVKAEVVEKAIREWKPAPLEEGQSVDSAAYIEKLSTAEMWRHACIIFLYQAVHRHGSLSLVMRSSLQQILQIGSRLLSQHPIQTSSLGPASSSASSRPAFSSADPLPDDYVSACSTRAVPWFLAATVAILPADRDLCRRGLGMCGKQQGYKDNLAAAERIWEVVDQTGWTVDWRSLLQAEKRFVGFL